VSALTWDLDTSTLSHWKKRKETETEKKFDVAVLVKFAIGTEQIENKNKLDQNFCQNTERRINREQQQLQKNGLHKIRLQICFTINVNLKIHNPNKFSKNFEEVEIQQRGFKIWRKFQDVKAKLKQK
jgi:hypothetical protein